MSVRGGPDDSVPRPQVDDAVGARDRTLPQLAREHVGLLLSAATTVLVALRVLGVSGWNPTTAAAIVQAGGATNVALAGILTAVPVVTNILLLLIVPWCYEVGLRWPFLNHRGAYAALAIVGLLAIAGLVIWPIEGAVAGTLLAGAAVGTIRRRRGLAAPSAVGGFWGRGDVAALLALGLFYAVTELESPFYPAERLDPPDSQPFTGYVVGNRDEYTLVLRAEKGIVAYESRTLDRELCDLGEGWLGSTVLELLNDSPYKRCPQRH